MGFGRTQTETETLMLGHLNKEPHHLLLPMRVLPQTVSNKGLEKADSTETRDQRLNVCSERHKVNFLFNSGVRAKYNHTLPVIPWDLGSLCPQSSVLTTWSPGNKTNVQLHPTVASCKVVTVLTNLLTALSVHYNN